VLLAIGQHDEIAEHAEGREEKTWGRRDEGS
jgi:hypothetical protein